MDAKFAKATNMLHASFERLLAMQPLSNGASCPTLPKQGVYLFSEGKRHLYVGRSRNIRTRYRGHTSPGSRQDSATFAMLLARQETGRVASYQAGPTSRKGLMLDPIFSASFTSHKARIRKMEFRCVEETDPVRQTLLEVYCAIVLSTPYNDFDTH